MTRDEVKSRLSIAILAADQSGPSSPLPADHKARRAIRLAHRAGLLFKLAEQNEFPDLAEDARLRAMRAVEQVSALYPEPLSAITAVFSAMSAPLQVSRAIRDGLARKVSDRAHYIEQSRSGYFVGFEDGFFGRDRDPDLRTVHGYEDGYLEGKAAAQ